MLSNLLASLASFHTRSPRCSLVLRCPPRLLCRLASLAALLASADLRSRFARACRLACLLRSPSLPAARFARPAFPAACSTRCLSCCPPSLRSGRFSCVLAPLAASPAVLSLCSSARLLLALLTASPHTRLACMLLHFWHGRQIRSDFPNPLAVRIPIFGETGPGSSRWFLLWVCGIPRTFYPTGELPPGEDCVFRRPPVVNIYRIACPHPPSYSRCGPPAVISVVGAHGGCWECGCAAASRECGRQLVACADVSGSMLCCN